MAAMANAQSSSAQKQKQRQLNKTELSQRSLMSNHNNNKAMA